MQRPVDVTTLSISRDLCPSIGSQHLQSDEYLKVRDTCLHSLTHPHNPFNCELVAVQFLTLTTKNGHYHCSS